MVGIRWASEEVRANYPPYFSKGPYTYRFTETEELIIQRCREKIVEKEAEEKLTHHERAYRHVISGEEPDKWLIMVTGWRVMAGHVLTSFASETPAVNSLDLLFHPNLEFITQ